MSGKDYSYNNRAEFILAGFTVEPKADGSFRLVSSESLPGGEPDWQVFASGADLVVWLAAGISEIGTAGFVADIYLRNANRR